MPSGRCWPWGWWLEALDARAPWGVEGGDLGAAIGALGLADRRCRGVCDGLGDELGTQELGSLCGLAGGTER